MCYKNKDELANTYKFLKFSVDCTLTDWGGLYIWFWEKSEEGAEK